MTFGTVNTAFAALTSTWETVLAAIADLPIRAIASTGRALEMNTSRSLRPWIPRWWAEEGGRAVTFGSDGHVAAGLAANFHEATALLDHVGFRPGSRPEDFWTR